jgi:ADP-heptose:LPS heptosyltransferase
MRQDLSTPVDGEVAVHLESPAQAAEDSGPPSSSIRTLLICRPNTRLGNNVLLTPLVQEIERHLPQTRIDVLTAFPAAAELFSGYPSFGTALALPYRGPRHPLKYAGRLLQAASRHYDAVIDTDPHSWTSGFMTRLMRAPLKIGFLSDNKHRSGYVNVPFSGAPEHMATFPVYLLRRALLGMDEARACANLPVLDLRLSHGELEEGSRRLAQRGLAGVGPVVAIAGAATGSKQLGVDWWRTLAQEIRTRVPTVRLLEIRPPSGVASFPELPGFSSRSLRQVAAVIAGIDCFVCADSGLMHLGSASRSPTLGLFKVTNPKVYCPYGGESRAIILGEDAVRDVAAQVAGVLARTRDSRRRP